DVVNTPMIPLDDLLPFGCVARNAATDQQSGHLGVFQTLLPGNCSRMVNLAISRQPLLVFPDGCRLKADNCLRPCPNPFALRIRADPDKSFGLQQTGGEFSNRLS